MDRRGEEAPAGRGLLSFRPAAEGRRPKNRADRARRCRPARSVPWRAALLPLAALLAGALPAAAQVRSARLVQGAGAFASGRLEPGLAARVDGLHASRAATYVSPALDAGLAFSAIGAHWSGAPDVALEISVSPDGLRWGRWVAVPAEETAADLREDGTPNPLAGETLGALVFVAPGSRQVRYRVRLPGGDGRAPALERIGFHVIDPGPGRPLPAPRAESRRPHAPFTVAARRAGAVRERAPQPEIPVPVPRAAKPVIHLRAAWGARPPKYAYTLTLAGHIGVHHTATVEDFEASTWEECAARMRAIQTYHMDTNGWNDVGYAWAICRHGDVFQAREDDDDATDVQGAHDGVNRGSAGITVFGYFHPPVNHHPTEEQLSSLADVVAWLSGLRGIDPTGRSLYEAFGAPVDNVYGHREVKATDCPGDHLFALKELIRAAALERLLVMAL